MAAKINPATEDIYGAMPSEWRIVQLRELISGGTADLQTGPFGTMLHASAYKPTGTPVVAVQHIGENKLRHNALPCVDAETANRLNRYKLMENDILFGRKGAVERRALISKEEEGWLQGSDCIRLRFSRGAADAKFISYVFGSLAYRGWIARHAHGATMPSLNQEILGLIPLPLPPLAEQRDIARILGALDDKIEMNRRMNETLEAMAQALFKSWFVDFDPVRAKAEGRDTGLSKKIADLFPDGFEDSELGPIPKGWHVVPFVETVEILGGGTPKTTVPEYWDGDIPWYAVGDAPREKDIFVIDTAKKLTGAGVENSSTRILPAGTTIISARGTVGKLALSGVPMAMNQTCYGFKGKIPHSDFFTFFSTKSLVSTLL